TSNLTGTLGISHGGTGGASASEARAALSAAASGANSDITGLSGVTFSGDVDMGTHKVTNLPAPSAASDAATKSYVDVAVVPAGAILPFGGATAPAGFLICQGEEVSRA